MHNGEGDEAEIIFAPEGALFRGFAHEVPLASWYTEDGKAYPGTFQNFPDRLKALKKEYLNDEEISFAVWFLKSENKWQKGEVQPPPDIDPTDDVDGSKYILSYFPFHYADYIRDAEHYYGRKLDSDAVEMIYQHEPLTNELIRRIYKDCKFNLNSKEFSEIGYPLKLK